MFYCHRIQANTTLQAHLTIHQSNCPVEECVQLVKNLLHKTKESDDYPYFALMLHRNTLLCHDLLSPHGIAVCQMSLM